MILDLSHITYKNAIACFFLDRQMRKMKILARKIANLEGKRGDISGISGLLNFRKADLRATITFHPKHGSR